MASPCDCPRNSALETVFRYRFQARRHVLHQGTFEKPWSKHQRFPEWSWRSFRRNWWRTSGKFSKEIFELLLLGKSSEAFSTQTPPQISPSNFTTRFWVVAGPNDLWLSALALAEIQKGRREGDGKSRHFTTIYDNLRRFTTYPAPRGRCHCPHKHYRQKKIQEELISAKITA